MEHTKGNWIATYNSAKERGVRNEGGFICFLPKPNHYSGQDERYDKDMDENKANAKLIAAAPELLLAVSACKSALKLCRDDDNCTGLNNFIEQAENAINKAKGI